MGAMIDSANVGICRQIRGLSCLGMVFLALVLTTWASPAHAQIVLGSDEFVVFESATLGTTGDNSGASINADQWLGAVFSTNRDVRLTRLGGHLGGSDPVTIAIVPLVGARANQLPENPP